MRDLSAKALDVNAANMALGSEVFQGEYATFVRNRDHRIIYDANHVSHITAETLDEIDRFLATAEDEYEHCKHRRFDVDFRAPPAVTARLVLEGFQAEPFLLLVLQGELNAEPKPCDIRPISSEAEWAAYEELRMLDWLETAERLHRPAERQVAESQSAIARLKRPRVRYWMAYVDGQPVAYLNSWEGIEGVGQVEDLFTHADHRRRGIATALIAHCVADCRKHGAGPVVIAADPTDTPKDMYAALGFVPIAVGTHYLKKL